jgi:carbamoyl-phosphate synthase large subunit
MKHLSVLVTGVGAIIGQGIVLSLRLPLPGYCARVIGLDKRDSPRANALCDKTFAKPPYDEDSLEYREFLLRVIREEKVDVVIPGIEHDVFFFDEHRDFFSGHTCLALNNPALIAAAQDKWAVYAALPEHGLPAIPTRLQGTWAECLAALGPAPLLLKPRRGSGSRGQARLEKEEDFFYWTGKNKDNFLIQRIIGSDDEEYTASVFGLGDGTAIPPIVMRRRLSPSGFTGEATVISPTESKELLPVIEKLNMVFSPLGATNYQFRKEGSEYYLLEINPRISSATSFRAAFGYNEAWMSVLFHGCGRKPDPPVIRPGSAYRYTQDHIEYAGDTF